MFLPQLADAASGLLEERRRAGHELEGQTAECPDVVAQTGADAFARAVVRRDPEVAVVVGELGVNIFIQDVEQVREVVVAELDVSLGQVEDVRGLEVAGQRGVLGFDVEAVEVVEGDQDVCEDLRGEALVVEVGEAAADVFDAAVVVLGDDAERWSAEGTAVCLGVAAVEVADEEAVAHLGLEQRDGLDDVLDDAQVLLGAVRRVQLARERLPARS